MARYLVARVISVIPTVLLLLFFVVFLIRLLPGNAVDIMLTDAGNRKGSLGHAQLEHQLGLDRSVPVAYIDYAAGALHGDLGTSIWSKQPVAGIIRGDMGVTIELGVLSLVLGIAFGIFIGVLSSLAGHGPLDYLLRSFAILGLTIPVFALGTLIIVLPTLWWGWSPPLRYTPPSHGLWTHISQFFTPALLLAFGLSAGLMRLTRTTMLDVLRQDYIRTARAKGMASFAVVMRHALRNAMIPVVSLIGLSVAALFSGTVLVEQIFGLPGMGRELITALGNRDYPIVQGITVVSGMFVIFTNLVVDLSYALIDPRVRVSG